MAVTPHTNFYARPEAVDRLGEDTFLKIPLWRSAKAYTPIYINAELYSRYISNRKNVPWQEMADSIAWHFNVTLDAKLSTGEQTGFAYVDRQSDPLNVALRGNLGSGRAYYLGRYFNVKGEKTPLCTTDNPKFSDGILEIERGIWETIISNVLHHDLEITAPPVLAILDMDEHCYAARRGEESRRVKIIRIDEDAALERITHIFQNKYPLSSDQLVHIARQFGKHEAEKFAERIIHGSWSPGNITPEGGILDFDTVCGVKGRGAQYSSSVWQCETYFGYEHKAQLKILDALAKDEAVNKEHAPFAALEQQCTASMKSHMAKKMAYLMGFKNTDNLYQHYADSLKELAEYFWLLSKRFYPKFNTMALRQGRTYSLHVFDFSIFFRAYPLLKRSMNFDRSKALSLMMETQLLDDPFVREDREWSTELDASYFQTHALDFIDKNCVMDDSELTKLKHQGLEFIGAYDNLFQIIAETCKADRLETEARAYLINEDRLYLYSMFPPSYFLIKDDLGLEERNDLIEFFIKANYRRPTIKENQADARVFMEGNYFIKLDGRGGHQHHLSLPNVTWAKSLINNTEIELQIDGASLQVTVQKTNQSIDLISKTLPNTDLLRGLYRDSSLMLKDIMVNTGKKRYKMTDYLEAHYD